MITKRKTAQKIVKVINEWLKGSYYGKRPDEYSYVYEIKSDTIGKDKRIRYYTIEIWDENPSNRNAFFPVQEISNIANLFGVSCYARICAFDDSVRMMIT